MPQKVKADQKNIIDCFIQTQGFYLMGPIYNPSGFKAPFTIDALTVLSNPGRAAIIGQVLGEFVKALDVDLILGIPNGGVPLATIISQYSGIPFGYIRTEKCQRTGELIQGEYAGKTKAVLVDDIIGRGNTKDKVLANLSGKLKIKDLIVLLHGGIGYQKMIEDWEIKSGVKVNYLARWDEITDELIKAGRLPLAVGEIMMEYLKSPEAFQSNAAYWQKFDEFKNSHSYQTIDPII
ncbi:MAG: phosphoribosyltransferase family protein [Candidatus Buchananbacteria bacterium]